MTVRRAGDGVRGPSSPVEDDGPGIPTAQREAVFGRFYRVEGGMASGSGLGLAIAREIARLMGGEVRLDSTVGRRCSRSISRGSPSRRRARGRAGVFT